MYRHLGVLLLLAVVHTVPAAGQTSSWTVVVLGGDTLGPCDLHAISDSVVTLRSGETEGSRAD